MTRLVCLFAAAVFVAQPAFAQTRVSGAILAAVADPARPAEDTSRDAARRPGEVMAFAGVNPGGGYPPWARRSGLDLAELSRSAWVIASPDTAPMIDEAVLAALKPSGLFIIEDHRAEPGSGARDAGTFTESTPIT